MLSSSTVLRQGLWRQTQQLALQQPIQSTIRRGLASNAVRIICIDDLPHGRAYKGDVVEVKPGYARNYLVPKKMALYATRQNFAKLGMADPALETAAERRARLDREAEQSQDKEQAAADLLRHYLRNKRLKIWRNCSEQDNTVLHPGVVDAVVVKKKLAAQLKIQLESPQEAVHLLPTPHQEEVEWTDQARVDLLDGALGDPTVPCTTQVKQTGDYLARISLAGGYSIPLRVEVVKR